ncbi:MAG TPA: ABC transporter permease [Polyangiaceae bacterium]|jgi:lipoprotein-releasing system permease protein
MKDKPTERPRVPQPWSVGEAIGHGFVTLKKNFLALFIPLLVIFLVAGGIAYADRVGIALLVRRRLTTAEAIAASTACALVVQWIVLALVNAGLVRGWIAAARGERLSLDATLGWLRPRAVFRMAWVQVVVVLASLVPLTFGIFGIALSLAPHFVADQDLTAGAALRASWRATRDNRGKLWVLALCALPIQVLGVACGVLGVCASTALVQVALAYAYTRVTGRSELPGYEPKFASRSLRALLRTTLALSATGFAACVLWVYLLPPVRGSAWTPVDAAARVSAILFGISTANFLLAALLPWILDRLEHARFAFFVAARHVRSQKSGFLTVISVLSICGVAISSCSLSSVISVMGGFSHDLKRKILGNNAHIVVDTVAQKPFADYGPILERVRAVPGVVGATPVVQGEVMMSSPSNLAGVIVRGIDPDTIGAVIDLKSNIEVGQFNYLEDPDKLRHLPPDEVIGIGPHGEEYKKGNDLALEDDDLDPAVRAAIDTAPPLRPGIIIGRELSHTLHVFVGDEVTLVSPLGDLGPMGIMPRTKKFRVAAIFYSGMYEYDASHVYTLIDVAQDYFSTAGQVTAIEVKVKDAERADAVTPLVAAAVNRPDLRVRDWRDMNRNLFSALKLERLATFIILSIAIIVASFSIICTLLLMVTEKGKEIAILKALGASDGDILRTFMTEGIVIGGIGTAFGVAWGLAQCAGLGAFGLRLPPEVYYIDRLPVHVSGWDFLAVAVSAMLICTLATIYPAYVASKLRPVDGLRYE